MKRRIQKGIKRLTAGFLGAVLLLTSAPQEALAGLSELSEVIAVFDKANVLELRLRVRLIGNENR
ncbi:MAG: hypothetical protein IJT16_15205 [Lachnospiraceae bacterium]|nr:hypothetical protein [Lachnospiraceae bacterium]